jgi:hypothetical protein
VSNLPPSFDRPSSDPVIPLLPERLARQASSEPSSIREGLPPTFRMRADSHYVDSLDRLGPATTVQLIDVDKIEPRDRQRSNDLGALVGSIKRHGVLQPLLVQPHNSRFRVVAGDRRLAAAIDAGLRQVPCMVRPADEEQAADLSVATNLFAARGGHAASAAPASSDEQAILELTRCLRTLESSPALLGQAGSHLTHSVAGTLIRAESRRAICFLQAVRVLRDEIRACPKRLAIQDVVAGVLHAVEPERGLRHITLKPQLVVSHSTIHADEELLVGALSGVVLATFALVDRMDAQVNVSARVDPRGEFAFAVSQDRVSTPRAWLAAAREDSLDHQSGEGTVLIAAARRAAEVCKGKLTVAMGGWGSDIQIVVPTV